MKLMKIALLISLMLLLSALTAAVFPVDGHFESTTSIENHYSGSELEQLSKNTLETESSNFTLEADEEWQKLGSTGFPFLEIFGSTAQVVETGDMTNDGNLELITSSRSFNMADSQTELMIWSYNAGENGFSLLSEEILADAPSISSISSVPTDSDVSYFVTGGQDNSEPPMSDLRLWSFDGTGIYLEESVQWLDDGYNNSIESVKVWDLDGDGRFEIVAGGQSKFDNDDDKYRAQLTIWKINDDLSLSLEIKEEWATNDQSGVMAIEITDLNSDGNLEIITGGYTGIYDGTDRSMSEIRVWHWGGGSLSLLDSVSWYDSDSCGVFDLEIADINGDGSYDILTAGANKEMDTAAEISIWSFAPLELLDRQRFFVNPGGDPGGGMNYELFAMGVDVDDFNLDGSLDIIVSGLTQGPAAEGYSGTTFWGYLTAWHYSGGELIMDDSYCWLEDQETAVFAQVSGNVLETLNPDIILVGYKGELDSVTNDIGYTARIWAWNYIHDEDAVTTYELNLNEGWNFVSFNLIPLDSSLTTILEDPQYGIIGNYDKVMYFDASTGEWSSYVPGRVDRYNTLDTWDHHMGIWIYMVTADTLIIEGTAPVSTDLTLYPGWTMVSLPSSTSDNHGLPVEVDIVGYFDFSQTYNLSYDYNPGTFTFEPGQGYWIHNPTGGNLIWSVDY